MDEIKNVNQVEEDVAELSDDRLQGIAGGVVGDARGVNPGDVVVVDDAYGQFGDMPTTRD